MDKEEVKQKIQQAMQGKQGDLLDILLSIPSPYFAFDGRPIAKDYPKAFKVLKQYLIKNSNGEISDLSDDDAVMAMFINPRMLYDFFDEQGFFISIGKEGAESLDTNFYGYITIDKENGYDTDKTRHGIEKKILTKAFGLLNEK